MSSVEAVFARATCLINVRADDEGFSSPRWTATVDVVDRETGTQQALVLPDGSRATFHAESKPLVVSTALAYLESEFGGYSEYAHKSLEPQDRLEMSSRPVEVP